MTRERRAVPFEEARAVALGHARPQPGQDAAHGRGRLAGRPFERGELLHLVHHAQAVRRIDEEVGRVLDEAIRGRAPQGVDEERRHLDHVTSGVGLPPDDPDPAVARDALVAQDVRQRRRAVARLRRKAQVLEHHDSHRQRRGHGHARALVAHQESRVAGLTDDQHRFFEARVEAAEVGEVRAVLTIRPHDEMGVAARRHRRAEALEPLGEERRREQRLGVGHPEVGQRDVGQSGASSSSRRPHARR